MDLKNIITKKAHETSLKSLKNIPPTLREYLTFDFLGSIANALSAITKDHFNYTGKIRQEEKTLRVSFTSSSQTDTIDLLITFETGGMKFVNINQKLEKTLDSEPLNTEIDKKADKKVVKKADKKVVKKAEEIVDEPQEPEIKVNSKLLVFAAQVSEEEKKKEEEEIANKKKQAMLDSLNNAIETLEIREDFKKKEQILDLLLKQEGND
jgi:hypothetical protein